MYIYIFFGGGGGGPAGRASVIWLQALSSGINFLLWVDTCKYFMKLVNSDTAVGFPFLSLLLIHWLWESIVSIVTRLWAGHPSNCDLIRGRGKRFVSSLLHPCCLWGSASLLLSGCQLSFPTGNAAETGSWQLTCTECQGSEWVTVHLHFPICLHGIHMDNFAFARFEVVTVLWLRIHVFRDAVLCCLVVFPAQFEGWYLHPKAVVPRVCWTDPKGSMDTFL